MIYTGTTPTLSLQFSLDDLQTIASAANVIVTFSEPVTREVILEKYTQDIQGRTEEDGFYIDIFLDQAETLKMPTKGDVLVQVNFLYSDGDQTYRATSNIGRISFARNLKHEIAQIEEII